MTINLSLQSGIILDIWKHASSGDPCNYRPIALTCIACKLMVAGIKDALLVILREHNIINASQHGFMARKSTNTHLLECNLDWNTAFKNRHGVDIVYLEFAKLSTQL